MEMFSQLMIFLLYKICISQSAVFKINTETISTAVIDDIIEKTNLPNCKLLCDASTLCQKVGYQNLEDSYVKCFLLKHAFSTTEDYGTLSVFVLKPFNDELKLITTSLTQMEYPLSSASTKPVTLPNIETTSSKTVTLPTIETTKANEITNEPMDTITYVVTTTTIPPTALTMGTTKNSETNEVATTIRTNYPRTCEEVYNLGNTTEGFYDLQLIEGVRTVECQFKQNHAYLRLYKRQKGTHVDYPFMGLHSFEDFYYFDNGSSYWLGLKNLHNLTQSKSYDLVVRNETSDIVYKNVKILGIETWYQINFNGSGHSDYFATYGNGKSFAYCDAFVKWSYFWVCYAYDEHARHVRLAPNLSADEVFWNGKEQSVIKIYIRQQITNP